MKKEIKKEVVQTVVITTQYFCDKCNKEIHDSYGELSDFNFELKQSDCYYPDGGSGTTKSMDLCDTCAKECVEEIKNILEWIKFKHNEIR